MMIEKCHGTAGDETRGVAGLRQGAFSGTGLHRRYVNLTYTIVEVDTARRRSYGDIKIVNQNGELVGVARHILVWVKDKT